MQRKVPGLGLVKGSNGGPQLRVRGRTAFGEQEDPQPLYIIDGMPIRAANGNPLSGISAEDIETVTLLKGPDAAMYGTDALNGVIVIATKRGGKARP